MSELKPCPLCGGKDVQLNEYREIKPDVNCNHCGITYQDQTVGEAVAGWNAFPRLKDVVDVLRGWRDWYNGPAAAGIGYIDPPLKMTDALLAEMEEGK